MFKHQSLFALTIFSFVFINISIAQTDDYLWRKEKPLQWSDYKSDHVGKEYEAAHTKFKIDLKYGGKLIGDSIAFDFTVKTIFLPMESWVIEDKKSDKLLNHEQLQFDIAELHARKMRKAFASTSFSKTAYKSEIQEIYKQKMTELNAYQRQYNLDTAYGSNLEKQDEWDEKVATELSALEEYAFKE
ncbi:DUF922 domain-containing protein [Flexithrix dorotheae]|uniref:DUF922 domain-containing protein n=1 Tax=Flexithrix dorotheae TaxID=70993 RepID=UPI0003A131F0|nr:hypothetical protein [Flexithrix dorotheae]